MRFIFGDRNFYKRLSVLMLPIILQQLMTNAVVFLDNLMVGRLSSASITGVFIANQIYFIASTAIFGLGAGAAIFMAQFRGSDNSRGVSYTFRWLLQWAFIFMGMIALVGFIFQDPIVEFFTDDPEIKLEAKRYINVILWAYLPSAITGAYGVALRTLGKAKWTLYNEGFALLSNAILNYMFIFGNFGAPEMGVAGAALSTIISRCLQLLLYVWMANRADDDLHLWIIVKCKKIPSLTKDIVSKAVPMITNELFWSFSLVLSVSIIGLRGPDILTASSIRNTVLQFGYIIFGAMGGVVAVMVGQELGKNNKESALRNYRWLMFFGIKMALVVTTTLIVTAPYVVGLFNVEGDVKDLTIRFIRWTSLLFPIFIVNASSFFAIRSGGKMKMAFMFDSVWNWAVFIPALYIAVVHTDLPAIGAFMVGWGTDIFKMMVVVPYAMSGRWTNNLVEKYNKID